MIRVYFVLLLLILLSFNPAKIYAAGSDISGNIPDPVLLTDEKGRYQPGLHLELLEDPSGKLSIEDVTSPVYSSKFKASHEEVPNLGFTSSAIWVRLRLKNKSSSGEWLLEQSFANMNYISMYLPGADSATFDVKKTGTLLPFSTRDIDYHHVVFKVPIAPEEEKIVHLRFESGASMTIPLTIWSHEKFSENSRNHILFNGFYFGIIMIMLLYNFSLLIVIKEKSYFYYILFIAGILLVSLAYRGIAFQLLWPESPMLNRYTVAIFTFLFLIAGLKFSSVFLDTRENNPVLHWFIKLIIILFGIIVISIPFVKYIANSRIAIFSVILGLSIILTACISQWKTGFKTVRYFLAAWSILFLAISVTLFVRLKILKSNILTEYSSDIGIILFIMILSLSLADRINMLKKDAEKSNRELETEINERKKTVNALDKSEAHYSTLISQMPNAFSLHEMIYDEAGKPCDYRFLEVNEAFENMTGLKGPDIIGKTVVQVMPQVEDYWIYTYGSVVETGKPAQFENYSGEIEKYFDVLAYSPQKDQFATVFTDITERRQTEKSLLDSEAKFRIIANQTLFGFSILQDGKYVYVNDAVTKICGFTSEELQMWSPRDFLQIIHPDDLPSLQKELNKKIDEGSDSISNYEYRIFDKSGNLKWIENYTKKIDYEGKNSVLIIFANITERKKAEEALRESEERLKLALEGSNDGLWDFIPQTGEAYFSPRWFTMLGYEPDEFPGNYDTWKHLLHPEDLPAAEETLNNFLEKKDEFYFSEFRMRTKLGEWQWIYARAKAVEKDSNGNITRIAGTHTDITERKQAEEALRVSEIKARSIMDSLDHLIALIDYDGIILDMNIGMAQRFNTSKDELMGKNVYDLLPEDIASSRKMKLQEVFNTGKTARFEDERAGIWNDNIVSPIKDSSGNIHMVSVIAMNISERKKAEDSLRENEERLKLALEGSNDGLWDFNTQTEEVYYSPRWFTMLGYEPDQFPKNFDPWKQLLHPEDLPKVEEAVNNFLEKKEEFYSSEFRMRTKSGEWRWIHSRGKAVEKDSSGNTTRVVGTHTDITERKQAQASLQRIRERYIQLFDNMESGVAVYKAAENGKDFIFVDMNRTGERIDHMKKEDIIGRPVTEVFPGVKDLGLFEVFQRVWQTGKPENHPISLYSDGRLSHWVENYVYKLPSGEVVAIYNDQTEKMKVNEELEKYRDHLEDLVKARTKDLNKLNEILVGEISEHKRAEKALGESEETLKASLAEKEVLMREIHHRVKNNLQTVYSFINFQYIQSNDEKYHYLLRDLENRVKSMVFIHEKLYQSVDLSGIDFSDYIEVLVNELFKSYGIGSRIKIKIDADKINLGIDAAIPCSLIVNELVTNSLKYAFPEKGKGELMIRLKSLNGKNELSVRDNGIGLPETFDTGNADSLGLKLVSRWVKQIQGKLEFDRTGGTGVTITFDKDMGITDPVKV